MKEGGRERERERERGEQTGERGREREREGERERVTYNSVHHCLRKSMNANMAKRKLQTTMTKVLRYTYINHNNTDPSVHPHLLQLKSGKNTHYLLPQCHLYYNI